MEKKTKNDIRHDLNEAAQMLVGSEFHLSRDCYIEALNALVSAIDKSKQCLMLLTGMKDNEEVLMERKARMEARKKYDLRVAGKDEVICKNCKKSYYDIIVNSRYCDRGHKVHAFETCNDVKER